MVLNKIIKKKIKENNLIDFQGKIKALLLSRYWVLLILLLLIFVFNYFFQFFPSNIRYTDNSKVGWKSGKWFQIRRKNDRYYSNFKFIYFKLRDISCEALKCVSINNFFLHFLCNYFCCKPTFLTLMLHFLIF